MKSSTLPAEVAGQAAEQDPDGDGDQEVTMPDLERDARALDEAREHVAAQPVGAHGVMRQVREHLAQPQGVVFRFRQGPQQARRQVLRLQVRLLVGRRLVLDRW